ncbi:hypothetical protein IEQ34_024873 [Dendrobium chrysotoxum]|uniref:Cytochrome b n=1 Tax=Dendrobium chrysotoxum TaxID=161865 RepID=A0AAV7FSC1_DENCH|nr:hypothetical protein IEQ34_024873 [Dendrobium chrysotoxum]
MSNRYSNIYINDGHCFLGLCSAIWTNVFMRCYRFSVNNATLNRFFALHFVLPFVLAALALMHLIALHDSSGSDLITIFIFIIILSVFVFFMPNMLGDSENYVMANPMQTPPAIVPE